MKVMAQGLPSDPDLHHSSRQCQSTRPMPWRGAWHMSDIVTTQLCTAWLEPAETASAQCPQPQQVTCSKDTQVQRGSLCTKAQAHLGSQSQCAVLPCIAGALPLPVVLIRPLAVPVKASATALFHPRHLGPAAAMSGCFKTGLETVFAVCLPHYLVCLLGCFSQVCL